MGALPNKRPVAGAGVALDNAGGGCGVAPNSGAGVLSKTAPVAGSGDKPKDGGGASWPKAGARRAALASTIPTVLSPRGYRCCTSPRSTSLLFSE